MTIESAPPSVPHSATGALDRDLPEALKRLARVLRAGRGLGGGFAGPVVEELRDWLHVLTSEHGTVRLTFEIDGLHHDGRRVLAVSCTEDAALARLHGEGVRGLVIHPGASVAEVAALLEAVAGEPGMEGGAELDGGTRLVDAGFASFEVVLAEATARSPSTPTEDLEPLRETARLVASAPPSGEFSIDLGAELSPFVAALTEGLDRFAPALVGATLTLLDAADRAERSRLIGLLASGIAVDTRTAGLAACASYLDELERWLGARRGHRVAEELSAAVFSPGLRSLSVFGLKRERDALPAALAVLRCLPPRERARALTAVCALPPSAARRRGIAALLGDGQVGKATELFASVDAQAARAILRAVRGSPLDESTLALYQAALAFPDELTRAQAVFRLAEQGGQPAAAVLDRGLADPDATVRSAALFALAVSEPAVALAVGKRWVEGPVYKEVGMDEKRLGALVLARAAGAEAVPVLRGLLGRMNVTGDARVDELRAAAIAGLGALGDQDSARRIAKLGKGRRRAETLADEAAHVLAAWEAGRAPYGDPAESLSGLARDLGLVEEPEDEPDERSEDTAEQPVDLAVDIELDAPGASPAPGPALPSKELIDELLAGYSFDDIPIDGGERSGT